MSLRNQKGVPSLSSLCLSLSLNHSLSLSLYFFISLSLSHYIHVSLSLSRSLSPSISLFLSFVSLSTCKHVSPSLYHSNYLNLCSLTLFLSFSLTLNLSYFQSISFSLSLSHYISLSQIYLHPMEMVYTCKVTL